MGTPIERSSALTIGTIESVSPTELTVQLDTDAPHATALNAGVPATFPRINGYVLVPGQAGSLVGQVTWIGIERSQFPKRKGFKDFGLIDLPFPTRRLKVVPIGTLRLRLDEASREERLELERGIRVFPSVGDPVALPTPGQLRAVVEVASEDAPLVIGRSGLADNAPIRVHPDRLFGRHLAVLGNTGSGKSCSVAGLIRWSIEQARSRDVPGDGRNSRKPRTRFIVLDPNGEYADAFADVRERIRVVRPFHREPGDVALEIPAWLWNLEEWGAILQAAPGAQQPILQEALRQLRGACAVGPSSAQLASKIVADYAERFDVIQENQSQVFTTNGGRIEAGTTLAGLAGALEDYAKSLKFSDPGRAAAVASVQTTVKALAEAINKNYSKEVPSGAQLRDIGTKLAPYRLASGQRAESALSADCPVQFDIRALPNALSLAALRSGDSRATAIINYLVCRLQALLNDTRLMPIIGGVEKPSLAEWLRTYLGGAGDDDPDVVLIDLSLVPASVVHLSIAVIARVLFEALQRHHRATREPVPTVMVLEEAHTFVQEGRDDPSQSPTPIQMCRRVFERIAREGRKFGLGLVLSSQRPSEISPTVLSQCNTFLLHRLVNDDDQNLVKRLVPDSLGSLLRELSVLPSRHAILLGHASPIPKLVAMTELTVDQRPRAKDPPLWAVWTGQEMRVPDWDALASEWANPAGTQPEPLAASRTEVDATKVA